MEEEVWWSRCFGGIVFVIEQFLSFFVQREIKWENRPKYYCDKYTQEIGRGFMDLFGELINLGLALTFFGLIIFSPNACTMMVGMLIIVGIWGVKTFLSEFHDAGY